MDPTYIIVFNGEDGKPNDKFAMIRVVKFEPFVSLLVNAKLFGDYQTISEQILKGDNLDCGACIQYIFVEIKESFPGDADYKKGSISEYKLWSNNHEYMYERIATEFTQSVIINAEKKWTFYYKRRLDTNQKSFKVQPIACESNSVILSIDNSGVDRNDHKAVEDKIDDLNTKYTTTDTISQLAADMTSKKECDEICDSALKLFCNIKTINSQTTINEIHTIIKTTFDNSEKTKLDDLETQLIGLRDKALRSIPTNMVNSAYRDLNNAGFNLSAKRDAYNETDKISKTVTPTTGTTDEIAIAKNKIKDATEALPTALQHVKDAAQQIAKATFEIGGFSFNILTELESKYKSIVDDVIKQLETESKKLYPVKS